MKRKSKFYPRGGSFACGFYKMCSKHMLTGECRSRAQLRTKILTRVCLSLESNASFSGNLIELAVWLVISQLNRCQKIEKLQCKIQYCRSGRRTHLNLAAVHLDDELITLKSGSVSPSSPLTPSHAHLNGPPTIQQLDLFLHSSESFQFAAPVHFGKVVCWQVRMDNEERSSHDCCFSTARKKIKRWYVKVRRPLC